MMAAISNRSTTKIQICAASRNACFKALSLDGSPLKTKLGLSQLKPRVVPTTEANTYASASKTKVGKAKRNCQEGTKAINIPQRKARYESRAAGRIKMANPDSTRVITEQKRRLKRKIPKNMLNQSA